MATGHEFEREREGKGKGCEEEEREQERMERESVLSGYGGHGQNGREEVNTNTNARNGATVVRRNRAGTNTSERSVAARAINGSVRGAAASVNGDARDDRDEVASQAGSVVAPSVVSATTSFAVPGAASTSGGNGGTGAGSSTGQISAIRSRVTVVCAECKRLKLRCDRRTPCGSCLKRDTVERCLYSPAAAEKIDVQSIHNRVCVLEENYVKLAQPLPVTVASAHIASGPSSSSATPRGAVQSPTQLSITYGSYTTSASPGAMIALCQCGRDFAGGDSAYSEGGSVTLAIPLEEGSAVGMWMDIVDVRRDGVGVRVGGCMCANGSRRRQRDSEDGEDEDWNMDMDAEESEEDEDVEDEAMSPMQFYAANRHLFHYAPPSGSSISAASGSSPSPSPSSHKRQRTPLRFSNSRPLVTPSLLSLLPSSSILPHILASLERALRVVLYEGAGASGAWGRWRNRVVGLKAWDEAERRRVEERDAKFKEKEKTGAKDKGKGKSVDRSGLRAVGGRGQSQGEREERMERPSLAFFAAVAVGMALGVVYWEEEGRCTTSTGGEAGAARVGLGIEAGALSSPASREDGERESEEREKDERPVGEREAMATELTEPTASSSLSPSIEVGAGADTSMGGETQDKNRAAMPPPPPPPSSSLSGGSSPALNRRTSSSNLVVQAHPNTSSSKGTSTPTPGPASSPAPSYSSNPSPSHLFLLARTALALHLERKAASGAYDLDVVHAHVLMVLYLLHVQRHSTSNSGNKDRTRNVSPTPIVLSHELMRLSASMVTVAKTMGLGWDPDVVDYMGGSARTGSGDSTAIVKREEDALPNMSLFEKEVRRRMWGAVVCCDLLVAESFNVAPLIDDTEHSTRPPAEVEDERFGPSSMGLPSPMADTEGVGMAYFVQRVRLAQLCKALRQRTHRNYSTSSPTGGDADLSLDAAVKCDVDIDAFLNDLPEELKLHVTEDISNASPIRYDAPAPAALPSSSAAVPPSSSMDLVIAPHVPDPPHLIAQRCYLRMIAHHAVLKQFTPFMKCVLPHNVQLAAPQEATLRCIQAAHYLIYASRVLLSLSGQISPATFLFYPIPQMVFQAGVVIAHVLVQQPRSFYSRLMFEDLRAVVDVLQDSSMLTGRSQRIGNEESFPSEAVRVMEALLAKARAALSGSGPTNNEQGVKRKHGELDNSETFRDGFSLPFAGVSVELDDHTVPTRTSAPLRPSITIPSTSKPVRSSGSHSGSGHGHAKSRNHASRSAGSDACGGSASAPRKDRDAHSGGKYTAPKHKPHFSPLPPQYGIRVRADGATSRRGSVTERTTERSDQNSQQSQQREHQELQQKMTQQQPVQHHPPTPQRMHQRQLSQNQQQFTPPQQMPPQPQPQPQSQPAPMHSLQPPETQIHPPMMPPQFGQPSQQSYQMHESTPMHQAQALPQTVSLSSDMPFSMDHLGQMYTQSPVTSYGPMYGPQPQPQLAQQLQQQQHQQHRQPPQPQPVQMHQHGGIYDHYSASPSNTTQSSPYFHSNHSQEFTAESLLTELGMSTGTMMDASGSNTMNMGHSHSMPPTPQDGPFHRRSSIDYGSDCQGMPLPGPGPPQHFAPQQQHPQGHPQQQHQQQQHSHHQGQTQQGQGNDWPNDAFPGWKGYQYV